MGYKRDNLYCWTCITYVSNRFLLGLLVLWPWSTKILALLSAINWNEQWTRFRANKSPEQIWTNGELFRSIPLISPRLRQPIHLSGSILIIILEKDTHLLIWHKVKISVPFNCCAEFHLSVLCSCTKQLRRTTVGWSSSRETIWDKTLWDH